jgi:hypothetical protein
MSFQIATVYGFRGNADKTFECQTLVSARQAAFHLRPLFVLALSTSSFLLLQSYFLLVDDIRNRVVSVNGFALYRQQRLRKLRLRLLGRTVLAQPRGTLIDLIDLPLANP